MSDRARSATLLAITMDVGLARACEFHFVCVDLDGATVDVLIRSREVLINVDHTVCSWFDVRLFILFLLES